MHDELLPYILDLVCSMTLAELKVAELGEQQANKAIDGILIKYARISKTEEGVVCYTSRFPISKEIIRVMDKME